MKKIFVVGGGTGGHLFPAIATAEEMIKRGYEVHLITDSRCIKYLKNIKYLKTHIINSSGVKSTIYAIVLSFYQILRAIFQSLILLYSEKPCLVVGFGGYVPFAPLMCAKLMRIPIVLHEQNSFLGKVNRWFGRYAKAILLTSSETPNIPKEIQKNRVIISGNPIRADITNCSQNIKNFDENPFTIVVTGGSQGAKVFSELVPKAIEIIVKRSHEVDIKIIQQAKLEDIPEISALYNKYKISNEISDFFYNMSEILQRAHLMIGRAGASTIAELIAFNKPAIFVPYPFAAEKHQHFNAKIFAQNGGGWWFDQQDITADTLADKIITMINDRSILKTASLSLKSLEVDSVNIIANTLEKIIRNSAK